MNTIPVALQMYTVRNEASEDLAGTLAQVSKIGYTAVELAGTYNKPASDLASMLNGLGLAVAGCHVNLNELETNLAASLDYNEAIGNKYIVCPWIGEERRRTADDYRALAATFERIGDACNARGLTFCYHNHAFEFDLFEGKPGLDILFESADAGKVHSELDVYWVAKGGKDPVEYLRKLAGRVPLVHLKDMAQDEAGSFAEVGEGVLDFQAMFSAAEEAGAEWYIVEQDTCARPPFESIEISLRNLRAWGKV